MSEENPSNGGRLTDGRFGHGNRIGRGRSLGSRNRATSILDGLADGEAGDVLRAVLDAAKAGDMRAAELVLSRAWPVRKGRPVRLALPEIVSASDVATALSALTNAVAAGEVTPDEAVPVASILEAKRKAIETIELEARVQQLEARIETPSCRD